MCEVDAACVFHVVACAMLVMFCWLCLLVFSVCQCVHGFQCMALCRLVFDLFLWLEVGDVLVEFDF